MSWLTMSLNAQSWILVAASFVGLLLVGLREKYRIHRGVVWGAMILIGLYWLMYSLSTHQYGFLTAAGLLILLFAIVWFVESMKDFAERHAKKSEEKMAEEAKATILRDFKTHISAAVPNERYFDRDYAHWCQSCGHRPSLHVQDDDDFRRGRCAVTDCHCEVFNRGLGLSK